MTSTRSVPVSLAACILTLIALASAGCGCKPASHGLPISSKASLKPDDLVLKKVSLKLAGSKFNAEAKTTITGDEVRIDILSEGQLIESEVYQSTETAFSVIDAGGERYDPPIPLIRYGMHVGDPPWDWSGKLLTGPVARRVTAKVRSSTEGVSINGGIDPNVIRIDVELSIDSGRADEPSTRKLTFWIAQEKGVVQRAFGDYSLRTPTEE